MFKSNFDMLAPIYPLLIQQFVDDYNLDTGLAIDIGTGPGFLGIELAKITKMEIIFTDIDSDAIALTNKNFIQSGTENGAQFVTANVENLPFPDNYADFIMSRGSIWFWKDSCKGLLEIERVLKPGCYAVIGGGLGRYAPETMRKRLLTSMHKELEKKNEKRPSLDEFKLMVAASGLKKFRVFTDGDVKSGKWVELNK